ncbi:MAG: carbohydrate ABC transporter permease, partial [Pseudomonadota bacterium]
MDNIAGQKSALAWAVNLSVVFLVVLWLIPTVGLLVSSFRDRDAITASGWWLSPFAIEQNFQVSIPASEAQNDGEFFVIEGNLFFGAENEVLRFGGRRADPTAFAPGEVADLRRGRTLRVEPNGDYIYKNPDEIKRDPNIYFSSLTPPKFSLENYRLILFSNGMDRAFINTFTVTIPATIIPILIAAFAAYALAWMDFKGRGLLIAMVVGLLVVPLQLALVPLLQLHNRVG